MPTTDPMLAVLLMAAMVVLTVIWTAGVAWYVLNRIRPSAVLTPADADDDAGLYVWTATVQYDHTGNVERFVIKDQDELSKRDVRETIEDRIQGADVMELNQFRLYAFGPAAHAPNAKRD